MAKTIIKATKSTPFMVVMGLVIVAAVGFVLVPQFTKAGSGAIWTTTNACGDPQNKNHYDVGDIIYVNGAGFTAGDYDWSITGKPGGASGDPDIDVVSDSQSVDASGEFCFNAYTVNWDDWGEYQVKFEGTKGDNYRVQGDIEVPDPLYSVYGYKWNDENGNGSDDTEAKLDGWTIFIDENGDQIMDVGEVRMVTSSDQLHFGWYWFDDLVAGTYNICEVLQDGWMQTYPQTICHEVTFPSFNIAVNSQNAVIAPEYNFGNMEIPPTCGDGVINQQFEQCDINDGVDEHQQCTNDCTLENLPYCGDGMVNGTEQCDGTDGVTGDQTCSAQCTIVEPEPEPVLTPVLSIIKSVDKSLANPGDTLNYTITVSNSGEGEATNVTLTDNLPAGLTFADVSDHNGTETGDTATWDLGTLIAGADVTVKYTVHVDSNAGADLYDNTAVVDSDETNPLNAQATTEVKIPVVLGETTPVLTIAKSVKESFVNPGGTANYTIVVTNTGDAPALNAVLTDTLPSGFVFADSGKTTMTWNLGDIVPTEKVTKTYQVKVDVSTLAGKYVNTATVKADDVNPVSAKATLEIKEVQVLGAEITELPATGGDLLGLLSGALLIGSGFVLRRKIR